MVVVGGCGGAAPGDSVPDAAGTASGGYGSQKEFGSMEVGGDRFVFALHGLAEEEGVSTLDGQAGNGAAMHARYTLQEGLCS